MSNRKDNEDFLSKFGDRIEMVGRDGVMGIMKNTGNPINSGYTRNINNNNQINQILMKKSSEVQYLVVILLQSKKITQKKLLLIIV